MEAAVEAFAERGFHGTTTRDIARGAGTSPAALYVHHSSKEELLYRISRHGHEAVDSLVKEQVESRESPTEQLAAIVRAFALHHARNHTTTRIINYELSALSPAHREEIARLRRSIESRVRSVVDRGIGAGVFDAIDSRLATVALLSLGIDISRWYRAEGSWSPEDIAEYYSALALRVVGVRVIDAPPAE